MVEFKKSVDGNGFTYEKGKRYVSICDFKEDDLQDKVLVRQPNSPKKKNWWTEFSKSDEGVIFRVIDDSEKSIIEEAEEEKLLQI